MGRRESWDRKESRKIDPVSSPNCLGPVTRPGNPAGACERTRPLTHYNFETAEYQRLDFCSGSRPFTSGSVTGVHKDNKDKDINKEQKYRRRRSIGIRPEGGTEWKGRERRVRRVS